MSGVRCPYDQPTLVVKFGFQSGKQMYLCRRCGRLYTHWRNDRFD